MTRRGGVPTPEQLAAIVAAVDAVWPRTSAPAVAPDPVDPRWRFSGRWWREAAFSIDPIDAWRQPVAPVANTAGSGWRTALASSSR